MSDLLTTLTVTAVAPFMFGGQPNNDIMQQLTVQDKPAIVAQAEKPKAPKKEEKKQEAPVAPETPKVVTYVVQEGDNLTVIAEKYDISWVRIWQKNEQLQNQDQLNVGDILTIPANDENLADRALIAPVSVPSPQVVSNTASTPTTSYTAPQSVSRPYVGEPNAYAVGWCTWWVKEKRPDIGGYWGNAGYNWISAAQAAGFSTGSTPAPGAIGVKPGHVVYVESVSGSQVNISEMGWGYRANTVPNYRTVSASEFTYIY